MIEIIIPKGEEAYRRMAQWINHVVKGRHISGPKIWMPPSSLLTRSNSTPIYISSPASRTA